MSLAWMWVSPRVSHVSRETWFSLWFTVLLIEVFVDIYLNIIKFVLVNLLKCWQLDKRPYVSRETYVCGL